MYTIKIEDLDRDTLDDMGRKFGIFDVQEGSTFIITFMFDMYAKSALSAEENSQNFTDMNGQINNLDMQFGEYLTNKNSSDREAARTMHSK